MSSSKSFKSFLSFQSSEIDEKKQVDDEEYHEETLACRDDIHAEVNRESWYKVRTLSFVVVEATIMYFAFWLCTRRSVRKHVS